MRLTDIEGQFVKWQEGDGNGFREVDSIAEANGVMFVCPGCLAKNGGHRPGVHSVICWNPSVPQTVKPTPGRWQLVGSGLNDLTLRAGSSSVDCGCWHGFITNGEVTTI